MTKIISIVSGIGVGDTALSAFDAALYSAGIANYNLIKLSSIIPEGFEPRVRRINLNDKEYGHRLYVVLASETQNQSGLRVWAGLGWVMNKAKPRTGLFVEHHGHNKEEVVNLIKKSLNTMIEYRPGKFGRIRYKIIGAKCENRPVCALVAAVYKSESWG